MIPGGLFTLAFLIRFWHIDSNQIAIDEPFTIFHAQQSFGELMQLFTQENNPPLHFILLHFWIKLFGTSVMSVRFISVLFGALTIIPLYKTGKEFFNEKVGIITSLLFCFSNINIFEAHDTRVYTILLFLTTWSFYFLLKLHYTPGKKSNVIWLTVINILMLYAHFTAFFVLFSQVLIVFIISDFRKKALKQAFISWVLTGVGFLPYLPVFITRFTTSSENESWVHETNWGSLYEVLRRLSNEPIVAVVFILVLITFLVYYIKKVGLPFSTYGKASILWFIIPYFAIFLYSFKMPMFMDKYLMFTTGGLYLTIAIGVSSIKIKNQYLSYLILALPVILMIVTVRPNIPNQRNPKDMAELITANKTENSLVLICPEWKKLNIAYHYNRDYFNDYKYLDQLLNKDHIYFIYNMNDSLPAMDKFQKVIYLDGGSELTDPDQSVVQYLDANFKQQEFTEYPGYKFYIYHE